MKVDPAAVDAAAEYYDDRHRRGWMDAWPADKKARVIALIEELKLPSGARVLEYGCGVGVFAEAVKRALPRLDVHGCDISATGVRRARERCPDVAFHHVDASRPGALGGPFDLIYSHHVLEHVTDLHGTLATMATLVAPGGYLLHITPCRNPGSLEARISSLVEPAGNGAGRFPLDDSSHLRRLSSTELVAAARVHGLSPIRALYANQFWGGIEYLTVQYHWTLLAWLDPRQGHDGGAKLRLLGMASWLLPLSLLRNGPRYVLRGVATAKSPVKKAVFAMLVPLAVVTYPVAAFLDTCLVALREREWREHRAESNGSEMYVLFERSPVGH